MLAEYTGVLVILAISLVAIVGLLGIGRRLAPRREIDAARESDASGDAAGSPQHRGELRFHTVACLVAVFATAAAWFYPWAAAFRTLGWFGFAAMLVFTLPLVIGLLYAWAKGGLDW